MASEFTGESCGIYPRVSSRKQAKRDRSSLKDQEQACRDYADEQGMEVIEECVKPEAYTSRVMKRPELNLLLAKMKEKQVSNLIIDRADRMTRAGQIVAATFLRQFTRAGILLHIVSMGDEESGDALVVRDDKGVHDFLEAAWQAQQENKKRTRIVKRAKRSRARDGYFLRGNKPPFGFRYEPCEWDEQGNVVNKRHQPDERLFADLGYPTVFAATPYAARKEMLRLYADGVSARLIADQMSNAGVPTPWVLAGRAFPPKAWHPRMVTYIVSDSINEGILTNFRATYTIQDPDDKHDEEWVKIRPVPLDKQIKVTPRHGSPTPLLDEATAARLKHRRESPSAHAHPRQTVYAGRALLAGRVTCARCGGGMRVRSVKRPSVVHFYYSCTRHDTTPTACVGVSLSALQVDPYAWNLALYALTRMDLDPNADNYLDVLAWRQANDTLNAPTAPTTAPTLADLIAIRDGFQNEAVTLTAELGQTASAFVRKTIRERIERLEPAIADANRRILAAERQAARLAERRNIITEYKQQYHAHLDALAYLDIDVPAHVPLMAHILQLVGAEFILDKDEQGRPDAHVNLTITAATAQPWFTSDQAEALAQVTRDAREQSRLEAERYWTSPEGQQHRKRLAALGVDIDYPSPLDTKAGDVIGSGEPAEGSMEDPEHPSFPPPGYSSRRW